MTDDPRLAELEAILRATPVIDVLPHLSNLGLVDCWLAGGAVRNPVWTARFQADLKIKDYDIVFYDLNGDRAQEQAAKDKLQAAFPDCQFDVKNHASFCRWRHNDAHTEPHKSVTDGVSKWLHTATAVGVRLSPSGTFEWLAPHGIDDLWNGIIRPTPAQVANPASAAKADEFLRSCPALRQANPSQHP